MNSLNIPQSNLPRIVIIGAGFAGLKLAKALDHKLFQVVLIDKNNYHQFQPLLYQVASAGLEPSSISFPLRKAFQKVPNMFIRNAEVLSVDTASKCVLTNMGKLEFQYMVVAIGAETNYFGNQQIADHAVPMKSVAEAMAFRNVILEDLEQAVTKMDGQDRQRLLDIAIVGGGPTGVEVAGALSEMRHFIIPKDYPEISADNIVIHLIDSSPKLLGTMSEKSSAEALHYLQQLGVKVKLSTMVTSYDGNTLSMNDGTQIHTHKVIWAAGVKGNTIEGLPQEVIRPGNRIAVDRYNQILDQAGCYAIGDIASMYTDKYPKAHPQVAQVAMQQAALLAKNLKRLQSNKELKNFEYADRGSMATIGRNKAVADLPGIHFKGFIAWLIWLFVHLMSILGTKNKVFVFINWLWNYITYDQSLRLILKAKTPRKMRQT
ncbi:MAG: NAD(P)/FAD-dependent oxidoreductase [Saprospiraceae bacterium]